MGEKEYVKHCEVEMDEFSFAFAAMPFYCAARKERVAQALTLP